MYNKFKVKLFVQSVGDSSSLQWWRKRERIYVSQLPITIEPKTIALNMAVYWR